MQPPAGKAYADYARRLDTEVPDWWRTALNQMAGELAHQARARRDAEKWLREVKSQVRGEAADLR